MTEETLISLWIKARWHVLAAQFAPTFLLAVTIGLLGAGLPSAPLSVRLGAAGVLLASGILGAIAQISAAGEGIAVIDDLRRAESSSAIATRIIGYRPWVEIVRFVTPAIFVLVYIALLIALFVPVR